MDMFQFSFPRHSETRMKQKQHKDGTGGTVATDKPQAQMQSIFVQCVCYMTFNLFLLIQCTFLMTFFKDIAVLIRAVHHLQT